jgi:epoxyqueuosine reductase QueG
LFIGGNIIIFEDRVREVIEQECEDYFLGIADFSGAENMNEEYLSLFTLYPRAISIGITLPHELDKPSNNEDHEIYNETNLQLNNISSYLSEFLQNKGYKAFAVPKVGGLDNEIFSSLHFLAAKHADLGMVIENKFITPEVGSGVNWGTIITDAPLNSV